MTAPQFRVSSYCGVGGCVAVAALDDGDIVVRDDKIQNSPLLRFRHHEWDAFIEGVKEGQFDRTSLEG